ncbi:MAG: AAA family ATPase [Alphaproteobacteria bacterium]|jgi:predicted ATPase|nr:AAA family ATPase [Alphaproteobacteria bacterium]
MKIESLRVRNFKSLRDAQLELARVNILVGTNSSGKSSVLQALHWACRCVANPAIRNNQNYSTAVASLDYYPTIDHKVVGHNNTLREGRGQNPEVRVDVDMVISEGENRFNASIPIKRGRNEALQVDLKTNQLDQEVYNALTNNSRPFTAYIPGLAGIAAREEKKSRLPVFRQAASGDANTVLRNILQLISELEPDKKQLRTLEGWVSEIIGPTELRVAFNDQSDDEINAQFRTEAMDEGCFAPLELAGTGVLQIIQIFSYLVLFRPVVILIDEPDAHLHTDRQAKLIRTLERAALEFHTQIILATHSPHLVRAAATDTKVIWMANGTVEAEGGQVREKMGWGLLDKRILLISEDENTRMLQSILNQDPQIASRVSVWPVFGADNLPTADGAEELRKLIGIESVVIHRDSDFHTPDERDRLRSRFSAPCHLWLTERADIESYFCEPMRLEEVFGINQDDLNAVLDENEKDFRREYEQKRRQINGDNNLYPQGAGTPTHDNAAIELGGEPIDRIKGKSLARKLRELLQDRGINGGKLTEVQPDEETIANDLLDLLRPFT